MKILDPAPDSLVLGQLKQKYSCSRFYQNIKLKHPHILENFKVQKFSSSLTNNFR